MVTKEEVMEKLGMVEDPELAINIVDLGLVYGVEVEKKQDGEYNVNVRMTLTTPACPLLGHLIAEIQEKVKSHDKIDEVNVDIVWDPP